MDNIDNQSGERQALLRMASPALSDEDALAWIESVLPRTMRRLMDSENLDMPLLQLPLAQLRLAQALCHDDAKSTEAGETMGSLSERLGVRHNALTQAADRLVNHGLAERLRDPNDRRIVRIRLTGQGAEWVGQRRNRRRDRLRQFWNLLSPQERENFLEAFRTIEAVTHRLESLPQSVPAASKGTTKRKTASTVEETLSRFTSGAADGATAKITTH